MTTESKPGSCFSNLKGSAMIVLSLLGILLAGSFFYYKERVLFVDAPHILFRIINNNSFEIAERRYGSFVTQMFPLVGLKLHCSLNILMLLYSGSFYIFFTFTALLLMYKFKRYDLGILLGLYFTLFVSDTYYWTNNEIHQGICWLFIAIAVLFFLAGKYKNKVLPILVFPLFFIAIWTHPLVMLVALFLWFFYWIDRRYWPFNNTQSIVCSIILLALSYLKFNQSLHHGYDSGKVEIVTQFNFANIKSLITAPQLHYFIRNCAANYWLLVILSLAGWAGMLWQKKYLLTAFSVLCAIGYMVLICITYRDLDNTRFYIESEYMPLSIICSAPFVYYVLPLFRKNLIAIVLVVVFSTRLIYIYQAHSSFTNRLVVIENINRKMQDKKISKLIIRTKSGALDDKLVMTWGAPAESMIYSNLKGDKPQHTYIIMDSAQAISFNTLSKDTILGCFQKWTTAELNHYYFNPDTTVGYRTMEYNELMK